jgi:arylsulfatase A-like enzyme
MRSGEPSTAFAMRRKGGLQGLLVWVVCLLPMAALWACGGGHEKGEIARNLILISIDTLRADHLGCYGYERETSPGLDRVAGTGVLFEDASAAAPWTVPAHMSMLTGVYTRTHGIDGWRKAARKELPLLAEILAENGFSTAGFVNVHLLDAKRGFGGGFQVYERIPTTRRPRGTTPRMIEEARGWLRDRGGSRFFLFLHLYDVHSDFDASPRYQALFSGDYDGSVDGSTAQLRAYRKRELAETWDAADARRLRDLYDAGIRQLDDQLAGFFRFLEQEGIAKRTLVIVTSDHGEELLDHGDVLHGRSLHEELVHVPLIMTGPGIPAGLRIAGAASHVDIVPTALSVLGIANPPDLDGRDLSLAWRAPSRWESDRYVFAEADLWLAMRKGNFRRSVRRGRFKLHYDHLTRSKTVFDLEKDPAETTDISKDEPALTRALWSVLEQFMESTRSVPETLDVTPEERERLEALGYL